MTPDREGWWWIEENPGDSEPRLVFRDEHGLWVETDSVDVKADCLAEWGLRCLGPCEPPAEDDDEPPTVGWLLSLDGAQKQLARVNADSAFTYVSVRGLEITFREYRSEIVEIWIDGDGLAINIHKPTRRQVRLLMEALE